MVVSSVISVCDSPNRFGLVGSSLEELVDIVSPAFSAPFLEEESWLCFLCDEPGGFCFCDLSCVFIIV